MLAALALLWVPSAQAGAPDHLADTGLDRARAERFSPQYPLWSDGAEKERLVLLPAGAVIDASNPDVWAFPVGTKLWKEFRFDGRLIETRYFERTAAGWQFAAYLADGRRAPDEGVARAYELSPGVFHSIPSKADCQNCHDEAAPILGFSALQLSSERSVGLTLDSLVRSGRISPSLPTPRIQAPSAKARAALGYLHGNCGGCHNATGPLAVVGLDLLQTVDGANSALPSAVNEPSRFTIPGEAESLRIAPGFPSKSALLFRMSSTHATQRMPPLGSRVVDEAAVRLLREFIEALSQSNPNEGATK